MERKITVLSKQKTDYDIQCIIEFAKFYSNYLNSESPDIVITCPDEEERVQTQPDFYLKELNVIVEMKGVHDAQGNKVGNNWGRTIKAIQAEADKTISDIDGVYVINTSPILPFSYKHTKKIRALVSELINAIKNKKKVITLTGLGRFKITKLNEKGKGVFFSTNGGARSVNPAGTIFENAVKKFDKTNKQLLNFNGKPNKRILLLDNQYVFGDREYEYIDALYWGYQDLLKYESIEQIWLQIRSKEGIKHTLLYSRDFLTSFLTGNIIFNEETVSVFEKWVQPLLNSKKEENNILLFKALKVFLNNKEPYELFNDIYREHMIGIGEWLVESKRFDDAIWFIDKFINDPDPKPPSKYNGEPDFNFHNKIVSGEKVNAIQTVLGRLTFVIAHLGIYKEYITKALDYTEKLITHDNLYVVLMGLTPLQEICNRRQWLPGFNKRPYESEYKKLHLIIFSVLDLVEKNPNYQAIKKRFAYIFHSFVDITTEETIRVLTVLKGTKGMAWFLIFQALFRERFFKDVDIAFDSNRIKSELKDAIMLNDDFAEHILWNIWRNLSYEKENFNIYLPYLEIYFSLPYTRTNFATLENIIEDFISTNEEICIKWFKQLLTIAQRHATEIQTQYPASDIWLTATEKLIPIIAKKYPKELLSLVKNLVELWKKGGRIGSPKIIFESHKLLRKDNRDSIMTVFVELYRTMKDLNPNLEDVEW